VIKLKLSLQKFYRRHYDLRNRYGISVSQIDDHGYVWFVVFIIRPPFLFYNFDKNNTTVVTIGTGIVGTSGAPELTLGLWRSLLSVLCIVDHCLSFFGVHFLLAIV
jgi:hypothetical protein